MCGIDRVVLDVEDLARLPADHDAAHTSFNQRLDLARLEIDRGKPSLRRDDQLVAVRRVAVLMEVEAGAARIFGETDYAMSRVGVDPFPGRRRRRVGLRDRAGTPADISRQRYSRNEEQGSCR